MTAASTQRYKVLLVDDNDELLGVLSDLLGNSGKYTVFTAIDGATALALCSQVMPDCVIVDIKMPKINGYQFIRSMRGDIRYQHIPMIILTALNQERDIFMGFAAGSDQYLVKPKTPSELIEAIEQVRQVSEDDRLERMRQLLHEPPSQ